ncbi:hypothetical protein [Rhizobium sp. MHM7A]|uniref:hypothetical protein n=1 Tax=Rhizobium sp. MHM7A TaxID=2583233 RepID=UPI0011065348|nr:hypothetical protein [Rhizobium sp. MHM7A]TLX16711.1 hypothetical protein FFR93_05050 [Rhizobium sp. MHM7A]
MGLRSFSDEGFPSLLSFFSPSVSGWKLHVPDIGANSGFPGPFDWNDHFDDDDGVLIVPQTTFPDISAEPGFKAVEEDTGSFAFISFQRSATWEEGVLIYRIALPKIVKTSKDREVGVNMELSAALAAVCLQMQTDWLWLIEELKSHQSDWTIRTIVDVSSSVPDEVKEAFYEISNDAACRFYDDNPRVGQFTGFEEPRLVMIGA